jgi:hypothetical protein
LGDGRHDLRRRSGAAVTCGQPGIKV